MTTYTKTQLIDMAIQKLGENPDWIFNTYVLISTTSNVVYGYGKFILSAFDRSVSNWQLVCTREEFEQRVNERKAASKPVSNEWWDYEKNLMLYNPPVGTHCEFTWVQHSDWFEAVILPNDRVAYKWYGEWKVIEVATKGDCIFRPLDHKPTLTERQQAGLKLWRAINFKDTESDEFVISQKSFEDYCLPYDQGLLK